MSREPRPAALHRYGQHHLVDTGMLRAILSAARVARNDVVLEVGAAGGLLTKPLLERAAVVHAFEIDRRFEPALTRLAAENPGLRLHFGDALKADLRALEPPPSALVANLPYNIAIPLIVRSLTELPSLQRWAVMVQRELGERLFARPGTKAYSAVSVLVQLRCTLDSVRQVPRTVFSPPPRVDSSFVVFSRIARGRAAYEAAEVAEAGEAAGARGGEAEPSGRGLEGSSKASGSEEERAPDEDACWRAVDWLVRTAFRQRRKMLVNSLSGSAPGGDGRAVTATDVRKALREMGMNERVRPEELRPAAFVELAGRLGVLRSRGADAGADWMCGGGLEVNAEGGK